MHTVWHNSKIIIIIQYNSKHGLSVLNPIIGMDSPAVHAKLDEVQSVPTKHFYLGLLESVSNLTVTLINSTTVLISWSPPFTLEGVPILGYNVTITNTTSGENETMLVEDTTLLYSIDHPDPKNNFTVTVVPINEVGAGEPKVYVKSTEINFLHKDELVDSKSSVRWSASTTLATFSLEDITNIYLGKVSIIKLILLKHAIF